MTLRPVRVLIVLLAAAVGVVEAGQGAPSQRDWPKKPERRAGPPPPPAPPQLPPHMVNVPPYTLTVTLRGEEGSPQPAGATRVILRAADRVHVAEGRDTEWFFRRNPLAADRVSGMRIDHNASTIVVYDESDVRNLLGINGWAAVVSLGFDHAYLAQASPTDQEKRIGEIVFVDYRAPNESFWWSAEAGLATGFVQRSGNTLQRVSIDSAVRGVDDTLLRDPVARFPAYEVMDVAEWLEHPARSPRR